MICPNCKKEIDCNVKFCPECGVKIESVDEKVAKTGKLRKKESTTAEVPKRRQKNRSAITLYTFLIGVFVLACSTPLVLKMHKNYVYKHSQEYLHDSIEKSDVKAIKEFIGYGLSVNQVCQNKWGDENGFKEYTPLMHAVIKGNLAIVKILVEAGANVNDKSNCYENICFKSKTEKTCLYAAAEFDYAAIAKVLIENGANVDGKVILYEYEESDDFNGAKEGELRPFGKWTSFSFETPLIVASTYDNVDVIRVLLDNNADLMMKDNFGDTAIDKAISLNSQNALSVLLRYRKKIYGY
ncbi:MAG: ankyrin repeat domain-containing protein [Treponema sp.]|nr:ankyrin repeat domain-containing protein [Treponema sp.]